MVAQLPDRGPAQAGDSAAPTATHPSAGRGEARGRAVGLGHPRRRSQRRATSRRSSWMATRSAWCGRRKKSGAGCVSRCGPRSYARSTPRLRLIEAERQDAAAENLDVSQRLTQLRPKIAYLAAKHRTSIGPLRPVLEMGIGRVESDGARLVRLVDLSPPFWRTTGRLAVR